MIRPVGQDSGARTAAADVSAFLGYGLAALEPLVTMLFGLTVNLIVKKCVPQEIETLNRRNHRFFFAPLGIKKQPDPHLEFS